jgi:predicted metal-dependent HD superfamily phosphohydrolase
MAEPHEKTTREAFAQLWSDLGASGDPTPEFETLQEAYRDPPRKYHTLTHIGWALLRVDNMADEDKSRGSKHMKREWDRIRFAVWWHDFMLEGHPDDEELSGESAASSLHYGGLPVDALEVKRLVLATGHDRVPLRYDEAIICDADLSILGADEDAFDRYEKLVREEWAHVPDLLFATARTTILKRFIDKPWIYMTDYGRLRWERQARANLKRSVAQLAALAERRRYAEMITQRVDPLVAFPADTRGKRAIARMFRDAPTGPVKHVLEAAFLKSRVIIRSYEPELSAVSRALHAHGKLSGEDVRLLLGSRPIAGVQPFVVRRRTHWLRRARLRGGEAFLFVKNLTKIVLAEIKEIYFT